MKRRIIVIRKKRFYLFITSILLMTILLFGLLNFHRIYYKVKATMAYPNFNKTIVIDPGHGGVDPGKVGSNGAHEKELNLKIAKKVSALIKESGGRAILTRNSDSGLYSQDSKTLKAKKNEDLRNRRKLIQESKADMMVSIHLNSFPQGKYYGAQTFYLKGHEESKILAEFVQEELKEVLDKDNTRPIKGTDSYYILKENGMPSILVECGFLSNPKEEKLLNNDKYQDKVAWAIFSGIMKYFSYIEDISR